VVTSPSAQSMLMNARSSVIPFGLPGVGENRADMRRGAGKLWRAG
jgi:hypothetical protein